jgi:uncharacterized membrane protein YphA (DoxX/SURF4 family)
MSPVSRSPAALPDLARGAARRLGFRFVFCYLVLYIFPFPLDLIPGTERLAAAYARLWQAIVSAVAHHVLQLRGAVSLGSDGASGDDTAHFVQLLCMVALSAAAALVWTLADRHGGDDRRPRAALRIYVRYRLGSVLFMYGMLKVLKSQFLFPGGYRLDEPFGAMSPMGLLWTFMGYSTPYNVFVGVAEAGAGLLLFFRRTTLIGALLAVGVMSNVVMINLSYDVAVKQWAAHLLLMGMLLLAPDLRRLADLLVLRRPTAPAIRAPRRHDQRWLRFGRPAVKALIVGTILLPIALNSVQRWQRFHRLEARMKAARRQTTYLVNDFVLDGRPLPSSRAETRRWFWIDLYPRTARVTFADERQLDAAYDAGRQILSGFREGKQRLQGAIACSRPDPGHLLLSGSLAGRSLIVTAHLLEEERAFFLVRQRFHWIEERPEDH